MPANSAGSRLTDWVQQHPARAMTMIVALAMVLRAGAIYIAEPPDHVHGTELANVAGAILAGRGIADAYGPGTGPTAHASPAYPMLLAVVYSIFGFGKAGAIAENVFGLFQVLGIFLLILPLCRACGLPPVSGLLGALFFAIPLSSTSERGEWEAPLSALTVMAALILAKRLFDSDTWSVREGLLTGVFCGTALLIVPALAPWFVLLAATAFLFTDKSSGWWSRSGGIRFLAISGLTAALVLTPWTVRNYRVLGAPIWSRSNFGLEFAVSNNDGARVEYQDLYDSGVNNQMHPLASDVERRRVSEMGEVAYNRQKLHEGLQWVSTHPGREATLFLGRIFHFWFPTLHRRAQTVIAWGITLLGLVGLAMWARSGKPMVWAVATLLFSFPLVYYLHSSSNRYFYPLIPVVMLFAGDLTRRLFQVRPQREIAAKALHATGHV
jgi:hypothetical protein